MKLIEVYTAPNQAFAESFRVLLEGQGIKALITPGNSGNAFSAEYGGAAAPYDPWIISVRESDAARARELLEVEPENPVIQDDQS